MHKNFNVVFPLADFCLGTLLLRSPIAFPQARGPAVPDVQPHAAAVPATRREVEGRKGGLNPRAARRLEPS